MNVKLTDYHIFIQTSDPRDINILKSHFRAPSLKEGYRLIKTFWSFRELIKVIPKLRENADFMAEGRLLQSAHLLSMEARKHPKVIHSDLREYQNQDAHYLSCLDHGLILNDPRTGKTPTVIKLMQYKNWARTLIIVPASLVYSWKSEVEKFWPEAKVHVVTSKYIIDTAANVFIVSKNTLAPKFKMETNGKGIKKRVLVEEKSKVFLQLSAAKYGFFKFDACIVDEAHFLRNHDTDQSEGVYAIKADHRYALTGTPVVNNGADYYGLFKFLYPKMFPSYWGFAESYFPVTDGHYGGKDIGPVLPYRERELNEMIAAWSVQRTRKEVMPWLPEKQRSVIEVDMSDKQRKLYKDMAKKLFAVDTDDGTEADAQNALVKIMRLRQLCLDPGLLGFNVPSPKTEALIEFLDGQKEPVVVMSWFTSYLGRLAVELEKLKKYKIGHINGTMTGPQKQKAKEAFQRGEIDVLLCNTISAGTGFTLDRSNVVVFMDKPYTAAELEQAEDRVCPTQQGENLKHDIVSIVCRNSIDQRIDEIVALKGDIATALKEGGATIIKEMIG